MWSWLVAAAFLAGNVATEPFSLDTAHAARWLTALGVPDGAGRTHTHERLVVLDPRGRVVRMIDGAESHVVISPDLDRLLATSGANLTLVHNHPFGNGLSPNDLSQLEKAGVRMVVAIGHDGSMYAAARGSRFPAEGLAGFDGAVYTKARAGAARVLRDARDPKLRVAFDVHVHHVVSEALRSANVLRYEAVLGTQRRMVLNDARWFLARVRDAAAATARQ